MPKSHPIACYLAVFALLLLGFVENSFARPTTVSDHLLVQEVSVSNADSLSCCYTLAYQGDPVQNITSIETVILTPGVFFSSINYDLNSGWVYNTVLSQTHLSWSFNQGNIPMNEPDWFSFCLGGWTAEEDIQVEIRWLSNGETVETNLLTFNCIQCANLEEEIIQCAPDGSMTYTFDFVNYTGFSVDRIDIREPTGQDLIVEEFLILSTSLADGETLEGLELHLIYETNQVDELCFELTPRHFTAEDILIECCTSTFCIEPPVCDECCADFSDFMADVDAGVLWMDNCPENILEAEAAQLSDCDVVEYTFTDINTGEILEMLTVTGNEPVLFTGLVDQTSYRLCMEVTRQGSNGEPCFDMPLTNCIEFLYECVICIVEENIDWDIFCPPIDDLVCGCDGMTYLNACAAPNWAGVTEWTTGPCGEDSVDEIFLTANLNANNDVELNWTTGGAVEYRYFLVQRRTPTGSWITISDPPVANTVFDFLDQLPFLPNSAYRIIGVTWAGKVVFSNLGIIGVVNTSNPIDNTGGSVWPNPANDYFWLELPWTAATLVRIYNVTGQLIQEKKSTDNTALFWDTSTWPSGIYQIISRSPQGKSWTKNLIIIR